MAERIVECDGPLRVTGSEQTQQSQLHVRPALPLVFKELVQAAKSKRRSSKSNPQEADISTPTSGQGILIDHTDAIKYGELWKVSRSRVNNFHGPPRKRRFRLTEEAIEYFQHFSHVKLSRSFPLTSIEKVELVEKNPVVFKLFFHSFVMELEASNPFDAKDWVDKINEGIQRWKEAEDLLTDDEVLQNEETKEQTMIINEEPSDVTPTDELARVFSSQQSGSSQPTTHRQRSQTAGMLIRRESSENSMNTFDSRRFKRKSIRRKLRLAPKLEKQRVISKPSKDEMMQFKKLHEDYAMIKYPRRRRWAIPSEKIFKLDKDNLQIMWRKNFASRLKKTSSLYLDSILEIRLGQQSSGFERFPYEEVAEQSFSLMYERVKGKYANLESLDLVCDHPEHFREWIEGLESLQVGPVSSMFPNRYENTDPVLIWLKRIFTLRQNDHEVNEREALSFADYINPAIEVNTKKRWLIDAHSHQHEAILGHGRALKWDGFVLLYNIMCGETGRLYTLFRRYAKQHKRLGLTLDEFKDFLIKECYWTEEDCGRQKLKELFAFHDHHHRSFKKYTSGNKPSIWKISSHLLSFAGFLSFLRSKQNSPINLLHNTVYQDMTQPLSHYFINCSHNTYLEEDQLKGKSSLDAYVRALLLGSRCVEIDCWDNTVGREPIIYHGYTLTTKLPFGDVIRTIKDYAFRMSHYPLIISIENHCSSTQQARMAKIFVQELKNELGQSILATENLVEENQVFRRRLPSPEELQGKILLKGSYKHQTAKIVTKSDSKFPSRIRLGLMKISQDSESSLTKITSPPSTPKYNSSPSSHGDLTSTSDHDHDGELKPIDDKNVFINERECRTSTRRQIESFRQKVRQHKGNIEVPEDDQELFYTETSDDLKSLIVYCRSTSIKPWSWQEQKLTSVCQMFSFSELSAAEHYRNSSKEFLNCTERQFVRTYPRGSRIESSNYNPIPHWNHGVQMVALNYQYPDIFMHLNQGRFRQNGGCGYVLKPFIMRRNNAGTRDGGFNINMTKPHPLVLPCNFDIELLAGQNLCHFGKRYNTVYVSISLHGIPHDCCEMQRAETSETFWPQWPEDQHRLQCRVLMPELCLVYFRVELEKSLGTLQLFGQNCIALSSLCPGIKYIQLRTSSGELIPESGLFVRMKIKYEQPRPSLINLFQDSKTEVCAVRRSVLTRQPEISEETCSLTSSNLRLNYQIIPSDKTNGTKDMAISPEDINDITEVDLKVEYHEDKGLPTVMEVSAEIHEY